MWLGWGWVRWLAKHKKGQQSGAPSGENGDARKQNHWEGKSAGIRKQGKALVSYGVHTPKWIASRLCGTDLIFFSFKCFHFHSNTPFKKQSEFRKALRIWAEIRIELRLSPRAASLCCGGKGCRLANTRDGLIAHFWESHIGKCHFIHNIYYF